MSLLPIKQLIIILYLSQTCKVQGSQSCQEPCFTTKPLNPTYGIVGQDVKLNWQFKYSKSQVGFKKWTIFDLTGTQPERNILSYTPSGGFFFSDDYQNRIIYSDNAAITLKNLTLADERIYQMSVDFSDGALISSRIFLNITVLPSITTSLPASNTLREGQNTTLFCEAAARPQPTILWYLNGVLITSTRFLIESTVVSTVESVTTIKSTLTLINAQPEDNGNVTCSINIVTANKTSSTNLVVHYSPRNVIFTSNVSGHILTSGESIILTCSGKSLPQPYYQFYKDGKLIQNTTTSTYLIASIKTSDEGVYRCVPINMLGEGPGLNISVFVKVPPTFLRNPGTTHSALLSTTTSLQCIIYGEPKPYITWTRINGTMPSGYSIINKTLSENSSFSVVESTLNFPNLTKDDHGDYRCTGTNIAGKISHTFTLIVQFKSTINTTLGNTMILTEDSGKNATWKCIFEGNPSVNISWYLNGNKIKDNGFAIKNLVILNSPKLVRIESELTMIGIVHQKAGILTCNGSSTIGNVGYAANTIIQYTPLFNTMLPILMNASEDGNISLTCTINGQPKPEIIWSKDGKRLDSNRHSVSVSELSSNMFTSTVTSTLLIKNLTKQDHGVYVCLANNTIGSRQQNVTLNLQYQPYFLESLKTSYNMNESSTNKELVCHFRANPGASITWYKDGNILTTAANVTFRTTNLVINATGIETRSIVNIPEVQKNHFGRYHCNVSNLFGTTSSTTSLIVDYLPFFTTVEQISRVVNVTNNITLLCRVQSNPIGNLTWTTKYGNSSLPSHYQIQTKTVSASSKYSVVESTLVIVNITKSDFGEISCQYQNSIGHIQRKYTIVVYYPPSNITAISTYLFVTEGIKDYRITATFTGNPVPQITWSYQYILANSSFHSETQTATTNEFKVTSSFTFSLVSRKSAGRYNCLASNLLGRRNLETFLVVRYPPTFLKPLVSRIKYNKGQTALLSCTIISNPRSNVTWLLDNEDQNNSSQKRVTHRIIDSNISSSILERSLQITNLTKSNSGNYTCKASNSVGTNTQKTELIVHYAVEIKSNFNASINITETNTLYTLKCLMEASPYPIVFWTKDNVNYTKNVTTIIHENLRHRTKISTMINFHNGIKRSDYGKYSCHGQNIISKESQSTDIRVWFIPEILKGLATRENKTVGENITITCEIQGHPAPSLTWLKNGNVLSTGFTTVTTVKGPTSVVLSSNLTISSLNKGDTGSYTCKAANIAGSRESKIYIDVQYLPTSNFTTQSITVNDSMPITMDCGIDSNPPISKYVWRKNNVILSLETGPKLTIPIASKSSTGNYTCQPSNALGLGPLISYDIRVRVIPIVTQTAQCIHNMTANGTQQYICTCDGSGYPQPTIKWTKYGAATVLQQGRTLILPFKQGITGTYECRISNSQGETVSQFAILVNIEQYTSWSQYSQCNVSCGGGIRTRTRSCNVMPCHDPLQESQVCNTASCDPFGPWSGYTICNSTCGGGFQTRTRSCNIQPCTGPLTNTRSCNASPCARVGTESNHLLFLYILIPIVLFLLIFLIVWLSRISRSKEDQQPIVVPINGNLSQPPSVRSLPTKREIYLPENNFGVLNAGYRPDAEIPDGTLKKERDSIEVEVRFGNEPFESDTDVEIGVAEIESQGTNRNLVNGFTPVTTSTFDRPDFTPVPDYEVVPPPTHLSERPKDVQTWMDAEKVQNRQQRVDDGEYFTAF